MTEPREPRGRWFRRHPRSALLLSATLGTIALLLLAEGAARMLIPAWAPTRPERAQFWVYDEVLGWAHRPGQRGTFVHRDFSVEVTISSQGLRDAEYPYARTRKRRMLVLGDSFGWGFGVEHEQVFSEILERRQPGWEVINASVSGYGTDQQLLYLERDGRRFSPDVVLLLFNSTDFENIIHKAQYWHNKPFFTLDGDRVTLRNQPVPRPTLEQRLDRFFVGRTYLLSQLYRPTLGKLLGWRRTGERIDRGSYGRIEYKELVARRLLDEMQDRCREMGARFVLVTTPLEPQADTMFESWSRRTEVPFLALAASFVAAGRELPLEFRHDRHWNPTGHAIAAGAIETFLLEIGVFDPQPR